AGAAAAPAAGFADLVARVRPAVVSVETEDRRPAATPSAAPAIPEPFRPFFGEEFMRRFGEEAPAERPGRRVMGAGTGFIIDPAGFIVTNDHVVRDAETITVVLESGERFTARVVGRDDKTDLALLKLDAGRVFPAVAFGDSDEARVGDWVVSIGNPFGLGHTVTSGIVSARSRAIGAGPYDDFLQIDAPINRGNSGGPTFNLRGEVIGVNTAIFSPTGGSVGIGFAIPSAQAKEIIAALKADGRVERGWLGVSVQEVSPALAESLGLDRARGALIAQVMADGPGARARLAAGDVIVAVDGKPIERFRDLPRAIAAAKPGARTTLTVLRDRRETTLTADIGRMPATDRVATAETASGEVLGMRLARTESGVAVGAVRGDSPAARGGLRRGDVILRVGSTAVATPADVAAEMGKAEQAKRNGVVMLVRRDANERFVVVSLRDA
ncbi:MAG: Do family serine endopeptidase, partial [Alphaproteobacteria bacterium]|nr:Do family serine endopeptidase [Alphaproteobacteria bacterium]